MNKEQLYTAALKMLNDKYKINEYSKEKFNDIYYNTYKENNLSSLNPNNDINKIILFKIKEDYQSNEIKEIKNEKEDEYKTNEEKEVIIENKLKELENIRANMNLLSVASLNNFDDNTENSNFINDNENKITNHIPNIQINNQNPTILNNFKTFIINTNKNNIKVSPTIDINSNYIYPCCISLPYDIKKITPFIILSINDSIKTINYTYICHLINNSHWDIWKPITDNYSPINLNNNNWNISIIDFRGNIIDLSHYYYNIIDVLENNINKSFSINIDNNNNNNNFDINDKIKIIKEDGSFIDNIILNKIKDNDNNIRLIIKKNNLNLSDFINSSIYNYNSQLSLLFKYHSKT